MSDTHITLLNFYDEHLKLGEKEVILDVRNPDEFISGHIQGAINIPVSEITNRVNELREHKKIYIHCKRGGRAQTAFTILKGLGLNNLVCVHDAGMDQWIEKGFPVKKG